MGPSHLFKEKAMFEKMKLWVFQNVIIKKVIGKVAKHAATAIVGLLSTVVFATKVKPILDTLGIEYTPEKIAAGLVVILTGLAGGLWNYIEHRFFTKK